MTPALSPVVASRLEKAAVDNGFDQELPRQADWLGFASTRAPLKLWLTRFGDALYVAAFSQANVANALDGYGAPAASPLAAGAVAARTVTDEAGLDRMVRRAFQLSRSLPDELLHVFEAKTAGLPRATEAERLVIVRVGQDVFRAGLLEYWQGRCAVTGLEVPELLRASHIKPWAQCETDAERLDVYNGLLLAPNLDAVFDSGLVTFGDDGRILVSPALPSEARALLGIVPELKVSALSDGHRAYLKWHCSYEFIANAPAELARAEP